MKTYEDGLRWAAEWVEGSLRGETNERVIEFGRNMAMTLRAAASPITQDASGFPSTTIPDHGQASEPKCTCFASPSQEHSTYCPREGMDFDSESEIAQLRTQVEALKGERDDLRKRIDLWFGPNSCSVCGGYPLESRRECICGGIGTMRAEFEGLRQELFTVEQQLESVASNMKAAIIKRVREKAEEFKVHGWARKAFNGLVTELEAVELSQPNDTGEGEGVRKQ